MKMSEAFPSKFLKAADLQGRALTVTIERVEMDDPSGKEGKGDEPMKPIVYFQGKQKGLVLNKTNAGTIAHHYSDESDAWVGKALELYPDTTMYQGQMVPCLRVRVPVKMEDDGEEIPF
jgi:hypothetical protein